MTVVAGVATGDVRRVFAGRRDAVMTGAAGTQHLRVINGEHRREHVGSVAILAHVGRLYMRRAFANGFGAVVAVDAIAGDVHMIEIGWQPASR